MSVEFSAIETLSGLRAVEERWEELARMGGAGALFRGPAWIVPWWHAYHRVLAADPYVLAGYVGGELVCLAPFYRRTARLGPGLRVREVRLLGDAGPRPPALDILCAPGLEEQAGAALAEALCEVAEDWDVLDLQPLRDPSRVRAFFASRLQAAGRNVESYETGGARRIALGFAAADPAADAASHARATAYVEDPAALRKGLAALRRISRLEWADREEPSPIADAEATQLLEEVTLGLGTAGKARLGRLDNSASEALACALVLDDEDRAVVVGLAVDPEHREAAARLLAAEARAAATRGRVALDVVTGAGDYTLPDLPSSRQRALRLRAFGASSTASLARTYGAVARRLQAAVSAPGAAAAGARAAWTRIRSAAAEVAGYQKMHLYRGELWTRGVEPTDGVALSVLAAEEFDALPEAVREEAVESLELDLPYCREKWRRGDMVVFCLLHGRPAGIAWSAFGKVYVPELGRHLELSSSDVYIHDVFVAAQARGRNLAPSMLEFMAHELRQRDFYRSWALIGTDNAASVRAFEKAAYAAVCDVIHTRVGGIDRVTVRPPAPEAAKLLGL